MYDLRKVNGFTASLGKEKDEGDILKNSGIVRNVCIVKKGETSNATHTEYCIYKYNRNTLKADEYETKGFIRSVLTKGDRIMCFSPPKTLNWMKASNDISSSSRTNSVVVEEFVEGIMINVFYDDELNEYVYATKSSIGGNVSFFDNGKYPLKTFGKMFEEVCDAVGLSLSMLDRSYCYSFVMQHTEYRIVKVIKEHALYLVATYKIDNATRCVYNVKVPCDMKDVTAVSPDGVSRIAFAGTNVRNVTRFHMDVDPTFDAVYKKMCDLSNKRGVENLMQGMVVAYYAPEGAYRRVKMRDSRHQQIKALRGNNPKLEYQYLVLRASGRVIEYLEYYPEHKKLFMSYKKKVEEFSNQLYQYYREVHILKIDEERLGDVEQQHRGVRTYDAVPFEYRNHVRELHYMYRNTLLPNKGRVNFEVIKKYINLMIPAKLMFSLNYRMRASNVVADVNVDNAVDGDGDGEN